MKTTKTAAAQSNKAASNSTKAKIASAEKSTSSMIDAKATKATKNKPEKTPPTMKSIVANKPSSSKTQTLAQSKQAKSKTPSRTSLISKATAIRAVSRSMNTLSAIPKQSSNAKKIIALVRRSGKVTGYQFNDGTVLSKIDALKLAKKGGIQGVGIAKRNGTEYLKTLPDGTEKTNLTFLPKVSL